MKTLLRLIAGLALASQLYAADLTLSANMDTLLQAANFAAARTSLGLVIGTDVAAIASPTFTGVPAGPTAALDTNTTQFATTAFVLAQLEQETIDVADPGVDFLLKFNTTSNAYESAALSDFATLTGSQTLTNKTLSTSTTVSAALTFADGVRQTFNPDATAAGLNVGSHAGDPGTPSNGDLWYDSVAGELTARIAGANVALGAGGAGSGDVATDTIWNAAGDLAVGTGADTAVRLAVGSFGDQFVADGTNPAWKNRSTLVENYSDFLHGGSTDFCVSVTNCFFGVAALDAAHPGLAVCNATSASANLAQDPENLTFGGGRVVLDAVLRITRLASSGNAVVRFGFGDSASGAHTDGVWLEYTDNVNSGNWVATCKAGATTGTTNMAVGPAANTWFRLTIEVSADGDTATFWVNGANSVTVTTANSIPDSTSELCGFSLVTTETGASIIQTYVDYVSFKQFLTTPR